VPEDKRADGVEADAEEAVDKGAEAMGVDMLYEIVMKRRHFINKHE
jgi:hypothetical protein